MSQFSRQPLIVGLVTSCLGCLAGCQLPGLGVPSEALAPVGVVNAPRVSARLEAALASEPAPRLTARQVADVRFAYARSLEKQGDIDQAIAAYQNILKEQPDRPDACLRLAICYDRQGKFGESVELYGKALKGQPGSPDIYCNRGYSLYLQHNWPEAEMNLRQAIAIDPGHARAHVNLGLVLARSGRWEEALSAFQKGGCTASDAHANVAFALSLERQFTQARKHYQLAIAADPSSSHARKGLEELETVLARTDPGHRRVVASNPTTTGVGTPPGAVNSQPVPQSPSSLVLTGGQEMGATPPRPAEQARRPTGLE
jgi:Tfp pilus assembly protein PilF